MSCQRLILLLVLIGCDPNKNTDTSDTPDDTPRDTTEDTHDPDDTEKTDSPADTEETGHETGDTDEPPIDADGDGWSQADDCDDHDPGRHPEAPESCDGLDQDCDDLVDEDPIDAPTWYLDADKDGWGDPATAIAACEPPAGHIERGGDCDDTLADIIGSWWYADLDLDGFGDPGASVPACACPPDHVSDATDCLDTDAEVHPGALERCNGLDDDCDGSCEIGVPGHFLSIQEAIDSAEEGDRICVEPGTYREVINVPARSISIEGAGPDLTILDGHGEARVVLMRSSATLFRGFTITGGMAEVGAGIQVEGEVTLQDLRVTGNACESVRYCAGVGIYGDYWNGALVDVEITDNTADPWHAYATGVGLHLEGGSPSLTNLTIRGNTVTSGSSYGVGIYGDDTNASFDNLVVDANSGEIDLEGIRCYGAGVAFHQGTPTITRSFITSNTYNCERSLGGGVYLNDTAATFTNTLIAGNHVGGELSFSAAGGGLFVDDPWGTGDSLLDQCAVTGNTSEPAMPGTSLVSRGGGLYLSDDSTIELHNTDISNNIAAGTSTAAGGAVHVEDEALSFEMSYSNAWDNSEPAFNGIIDPSGSEGNIAADPEYTDTSSASPLEWDMNLLPGSALIDAGDPTVLDPDSSLSDIGLEGGPLATSHDGP